MRQIIARYIGLYTCRLNAAAPFSLASNYKSVVYPTDLRLKRSTRDFYRPFHLDLPIGAVSRGLVIATAAHGAAYGNHGSAASAIAAAAAIGSGNDCARKQQQQRQWLALLVRDIDRTFAFHRPLSTARCVEVWKSNCR